MSEYVVRPVSTVEIAGSPMVAKWDYDRVAQQLAGAVDALRSIAGKSRPSGEYCQRVARLALEKLGDEHYTPRGQPDG